MAFLCELCLVVFDGPVRGQSHWALTSSRLVRRRMLSETTETDQMRTPYTNGKNRKTEEKERDFTVL